MAHQRFLYPFFRDLTAGFAPPVPLPPPPSPAAAPPPLDAFVIFKSVAALSWRSAFSSSPVKTLPSTSLTMTTTAELIGVGMPAFLPMATTTPFK